MVSRCFEESKVYIAIMLSCGTILILGLEWLDLQIHNIFHLPTVYQDALKLFQICIAASHIRLDWLDLVTNPALLHLDLDCRARSPSKSH